MPACVRKRSDHDANANGLRLHCRTTPPHRHPRSIQHPPIYSASMEMRLSGAFGPPRSCTRIWPVFSLPAQPRSDRIIFDIADDAFLLSRITHPAIKIVPAPKRARPAEQAIRLLRAGYFDSGNHAGEIAQRAEQRVNMVGHHDPAANFIEAHSLSSQPTADNDLRDICTARPLKTCIRRIESTVISGELGSLRSPDLSDSNHGK